MTGRLASTKRMEMCVLALAAKLDICHLSTSAFLPVKIRGSENGGAEDQMRKWWG